MEKTKDWELYERGKKFNQGLKGDYYKTCKINTDFYEGNQWGNCEDTKLSKPTLNILKRVGSYFIASLTSMPIKMTCSALMYENLAKGISPELDEIVDKVDIANATLKKILERNKFDAKIKKALEKAVKTGDMVMHVRFDTSIKPYVYAPKHQYQGDLVIDVLNGTNVFFGNGNTNEVSKQPYILITGRDSVENLMRERKAHKNDDGNDIQSDRNIEYEVGNTEEVDSDKGNALYVIKYFKKDGKVYMNKSLEHTVICENIDTGFTEYPIVFANWEEQEGCYHGRALVTGLIANQVFINRMWAMVMYHLTLNAFPKALYDASRINAWTNDIGIAVGVRNNGDPNFNINNIAKYIEPAQMSPQVSMMLDSIMATTKDMLGISDATLGNINPTNTSAIVAVQKSSAVPLKNVQHNLFQLCEDLSIVLLDGIANKYGIRDIAIDVEERQEIIKFDFGILKDLPLSMNIEISEGGYYDELAQLQTLDNLLINQQIDIVDYLERVPDNIVIKRQELIKKKKVELAQAQQQAQAEEQTVNEENQANEIVEYVKGLPKEFQQYLSTLGDKAIEVVTQLMQMPPNEQQDYITQIMNGSI